MLNKKMEDALNQQINREMYSAYLYMSMSNFAQSQGLKGIATWFMIQYHEEMVHAMKFLEYINDKGGTVTLGAIEKPESSFKSMLEMMEKTLAHEQFITKSINDLMDLAISEKDYATKVLLDWYVTEQVEEEKNAMDNVQMLKMVGDKPNTLYMVDREFGARTVTVPTDFSKGVSAAMGGA
ncbi:MAG: ferritin [Chitinispirillaceae bacterium]|nr:ferritin [Chitinispirillaceae bacterium]